MAGRKLSARATTAVGFLDYLAVQCELLGSQIEDYAFARKAATADWIRTQIARELAHLRQRAMAKNEAMLADEIGRLGVQASTGGSQQMKSRVLRDGIASLRAAVERRRKATVDADVAAAKKEAESAAAEEAAAAEDDTPPGAEPPA
jgi:hypothetical protein